MTTVVDLEPDRYLRHARRGHWPDGLDLEAMTVDELHLWVDLLESQTVPESYWRKATGGQERHYTPQHEPRREPAPAATAEQDPKTTFRAGIRHLRATLDQRS